jgi:phosphoglucomutase
MIEKEQIVERARVWLGEEYGAEINAAVADLLSSGGSDLDDAFYKDMEFGTGGMRGLMGPGTNRINKHTLGMATQGLCNYLNQCFPGQDISVAIAYDCRNNSQTFAQHVAEVFSGNDIKVYLYESLRPTPQLSYTIRDLGCKAGIVLTASHNPKEYNGYKVYWEDGAQIVPPHDRSIIEEVRKIRSPKEVAQKKRPELIEVIGSEMDERFRNAVVEQGFLKGEKEDLCIVFTSLHGTSIMGVPQVLKKAGFTDVHIVEEQAIPDGNFPTVDSPNPEEPAALDMALQLARKIDADIVIGTDPDADRIGIAVKNEMGELELLNGNQTGAVMAEYLLKKWKASGKLSDRSYIASTIVTSELLKDIAHHYGVDCPETLTGFKWIADVIRARETDWDFVGGGEESYGFMIGDFVRDKDSVSSTLIACEIAAEAKSQGSSFFGLLQDIYLRHGLYRERLVSIVKKGMDGAAEIGRMMEALRKDPPTEIWGEKVVRVYDHQLQEIKDLDTGKNSTTGLPKSNVLQFVTESGTKVSARPSGTEPKIKFYVSVKAPMARKDVFRATVEGLEKKMDDILIELNLTS